MKDQENISEIDQYIIDFIRNLREVHGLTQDGLASILQVGKSFVSNVESLNNRAKYNLTHINILADHFNKSPKDFLPAKAFPVDKSKEGKFQYPSKNKNKKSGTPAAKAKKAITRK